jgi:hypothetical protein
MKWRKQDEGDGWVGGIKGGIKEEEEEEEEGEVRA